MAEEETEVYQKSYQDDFGDELFWVNTLKPEHQTKRRVKQYEYEESELRTR